MAISFPSSQFKYVGSRYNFVAVMYADRQPETNYVLNNQFISQFFYTNTLNNLVLEGELDYSDNEGKVINFIQSTFLNIDVGFTKCKENSDGSISIQELDPKFQFKCSFIVDNIEITGRDQNVISYKFHLVSDNWLKCAQTLDFTNYDKDPEPVISVIQACIKQNNLEVDLSSFESTKANVKLNYMTNGNDDLFTATKYLLNRLYYTQDRDDSLKFIMYDEHQEKYKMFDVKQLDQQKSGMNSIILSMNKSTLEHMAYDSPNKLASVVSYPKTSTIKAIFNREVATYDLSSNQLSCYQISSDTTVDYYNKRYATTQQEDKMSKLKLLDSIASNSLQRHCVWNNTVDVYNSLTADVLGDNALVVNTTGQILRKPSDAVFIQLPQDKSDLKSDDEDAYKDWEIRYKELTGLWITAKVVHIISPQQETYRQNLVLFKNYIEDIDTGVSKIQNS